MLNWVRVSEGAFGHLLTPESKLGMNSVISAKRIGEKIYEPCKETGDRIE